MRVFAPCKFNLPVFFRILVTFPLRFRGLIRLFREHCPEQMQPSIPHHWNQVIAFDIQLDIFPGGPHGPL